METTLKMAYVAAQDPARMRAFYAEALGLEMRFQDGDRWSQFKAGRADLGISSLEEAAPCAAGTVVVFEVGDLGAAGDAVTRAGGKVLTRRDMGSHGQVATCTDVEGNPFQLFAPAAKPGA